ncbi:unnamed protein product (macronuclear) [Paramecium tetraurelia]|uniref:Ubiquitin carboxyl-terminal hydrolase n=1 Tax=Paramecium tetraurelia TaxID=5888 RepID=A0DVR1_PARTE|nr:uncharacterized protein GSPATT00020781001 [Paramecium tetraurelia]CAK87128.1 unnamed protein product [Paramecium tetraurelia]|eukprot:XP_001454525.1 hypothetical protein (macronuclear) [Paramecium tetraurelia strain d4-2]
MGLCTSKDAVSESSIRRVHPLNMENSVVLTINYAKIPNKFKRLPQNKSCGLIGLQNLGNTCYINAAIQCLSNTQPLTEYFQQNLHNHELNIENPLSSRGQITNAYARLICSLWKESYQKSINPIELISMIQLWNPFFVMNSQQDSHELLAFLLDMLHEDLNRVKHKPYIEEKTYDQQPNQQQANKAWSDYLKRNRSIIVDLFQGQSINMLQCMVCNTKSYKFETFMYLSLPIQQDADLIQCISEYLREEELDEANQWHCSKCKSVKKSKKGIKLWKLPNILVIHLKRFKFTANYRCKLRWLINFPMYNLDLSNYSEQEQATYDLYGVINHSGTLHSGHYTSNCKNKDTQKWYNFDDTRIKEIMEKEVLTSDAYLLFYYKNSVDSYERQSEVIRSSIINSSASLPKQSSIIHGSYFNIPHTKLSISKLCISETDQQLTTPQIFGKKKSLKTNKLTPLPGKKPIFFASDNQKIQ